MPRQSVDEDNRVALTPQGVEVLVALGHSVVVEAGAADDARFTDEQYASAGARIVASHDEAFDADVVVRAAMLTAEEVELVREGQVIITFVMQQERDTQLFTQIAQRGCHLIAIDWLSDGEDEPVAVRSLGELAGMLAITTAAQRLESTGGGKGVIIGGITGVAPTEVVILGSSMSSLCAAKTALALGAAVKVFDKNRLQLQRMAQQLPHHVFTSMLHPQALSKAMTSADVVIVGRTMPDDDDCYLEPEMLPLLKPKAVVLDLHCPPEITTLAPHTASIVLSDILTPVIERIAECGGVEEAIKTERNIARGTVVTRGVCTNEYVARRFGVDYYDINLLIF